VIIDGKTAYTGSANLTGAGMGARSVNKRNFEAGIITTDPDLVRPIMAHFDSIWMGAHCESCRQKQHCADYKDILPGRT
jgi:phosphatidylserine/phosphatidylglycerophosphate/cardiolipin synthase-like enzyme